MNGSKVLAVEFGITVGVAAWAALKEKYWPWPPTIVKSAIAFSVLGIVSAVSEELAATLGAGFILANLLRMYQSKTPYIGGVPRNDPKFQDYTLLIIGVYGINKKGAVTPSSYTNGPSAQSPLPNTPVPLATNTPNSSLRSV